MADELTTARRTGRHGAAPPSPGTPGPAVEQERACGRLRSQPAHLRAPLDRRTPGETDLSAFTLAGPRPARHRVDTRRAWLRVVREPATGRPALRALVLADIGRAK